MLTDDGGLQHRLSHPKFRKEKGYYVQVEGIPDAASVARLQRGVTLKDGLTAPAKVRAIDEPELWPRDPPVRFRASIPTSWLDLRITEGRNRQVRRMTAAVGFPTLRLVRYSVGPLELGDLGLGEWREVPVPTQLLRSRR